MYKLKPLQNCSDIVINSPMYSLKNLQECGQASPLPNHDTLAPHHEQQGSSERSAASKLCSIQDEVLMQLKALKGQLSSLRLELKNKGSNPENCKNIAASISKGSQLKTTQNDTSLSTYNIVINASPDYAPYSLLAVEKWWNGMIGTKIVSYLHSSVKKLPEHLSSFTTSKEAHRSVPKIAINITLIWKKVDVDCELIISPLKQTAIRGEVNFLKFFNRLVNEALGITGDLLQETVLDSILDSCHQLSHSKNTKERSELLNVLSSYINKNQSSSGNNFTLVDLALWSIISRNKKQSLPSNLKDWYERISDFLGVKI